MKIIKLVLWFYFGWLLFPSFNNGLINFILKILLFLVEMHIINIILSEIYSYIDKNWRQIHLKYIDEREHIKGNSLANLTRMDFIGATFRLWFYIRHNKKRFIQEVFYNYLENMVIYMVAVTFIFIIIAFIIFINIYF